jgi:hypothetical protein
MYPSALYYLPVAGPAGTSCPPFDICLGSGAEWRTHWEEHPGYAHEDISLPHFEYPLASQHLSSIGALVVLYHFGRHFSCDSACFYATSALVNNPEWDELSFPQRFAIAKEMSSKSLLQHTFTLFVRLSASPHIDELGVCRTLPSHAFCVLRDTRETLDSTLRRLACSMPRLAGDICMYNTWYSALWEAIKWLRAVYVYRLQADLLPPLRHSCKYEWERIWEDVVVREVLCPFGRSWSSSEELEKLLQDYATSALCAACSDAVKRLVGEGAYFTGEIAGIEAMGFAQFICCVDRSWQI